MADVDAITDENGGNGGGPLTRIGLTTVSMLTAFGEFWVFAAQTVMRSLPTLFRPRDLARLLPQCYLIGALSVPVILVTGLFVGMVLAVQAIEQFQAVGLADRMGVIVSMFVVRELGPVLAGVRLAGRVGGALTAELGTMNVTEQLDALRSMGSDPIRVLVAPRFVACLLLTPLLTMYCNLMGVLGGWLICVPVKNLTSFDYWGYTVTAVEWWDLFNGLLKSVFFGAFIGLIACYKGFRCGPGAQGVGQACTDSFVASFVVILIVDFFIALTLAGVDERVWGFKSVF